MSRLVKFSSAIIFALFLAACDTAEERADEHYQNALALLADGDTDRAIVELRNALRLVPNHKEARYEVARAQLRAGSLQRAYSEFLRLVEQYPEELEARIELAEMAFLSTNWDELVRHGTIVRDLAPDNDRVKVIAVALDYRAALEAEDDLARAEQLNVARQLFEADPSNRFLLELVLDDLLRDQDFTGALALLDNLTELFPDTQRYWIQRLQVLLAVGDQDAVEAQLIDLVERYPDSTEQKQMLVRYYLSREELDKTEGFLRDWAEAEAEAEVEDEESVGARVDLIRFLTETRGVEAARIEMVKAINTVEDPTPFVILMASSDFATGNVDVAIQSLESAIENAEPSEQTNDMKVSLARMLLVTGNEVGARALVGEVLAESPNQVGALKMNAAWLIEADDTDGAIAALRTALDADGDDYETMTLMASAYLRTGSTDLARDFLALAVEVSGNAPDQTVRYAQLLIAEERYLPAEDVLLPALRVSPNDLNLLRTAAELYLAMEDNGRLSQVVATLKRLDTAPANRLAIRFEAELLNRTSGSEEALAFLESVANSEEADLQSRILLLRGRLSAQDFATAITIAEDIVADEPERPELKAVLAATLGTAGDIERSIALYKELIEEFPDQPRFHLEVAKSQSRIGNPEEARATINAALEDMPNDFGLLWASASYLEQDGDVDGAIDVYENLYGQNSGNIIVANNLASLIATYRDDQVSLDRAWTIARRFSNSEIPAIQDTYGWILHRRGDSEEALEFLERAALSLATDPVVQFHYAEALFATERLDDALVQYRATLELAGIGDTRPQMAIAQERIAEIEASLAEAQ